MMGVGFMRLRIKCVDGCWQVFHVNPKNLPKLFKKYKKRIRVF